MVILAESEVKQKFYLLTYLDTGLKLLKFTCYAFNLEEQTLI